MLTIEFIAAPPTVAGGGFLFARSDGRTKQLVASLHLRGDHSGVDFVYRTADAARGGAGSSNGTAPSPPAAKVGWDVGSLGDNHFHTLKLEVDGATAVLTIDSTFDAGERTLAGNVHDCDGGDTECTTHLLQRDGDGGAADSYGVLDGCIFSAAILVSV